LEGEGRGVLVWAPQKFPPRERAPRPRLCRSNDSQNGGAGCGLRGGRPPLQRQRDRRIDGPHWHLQYECARAAGAATRSRAAPAVSKAFRFHEHGGPEVLRFEDAEVGAPGPGEVRIRNVAVAVNYRDVLMRRGVHAVKSLPSAIGLESAGLIEALGPGVNGFAVGDRVVYAGMPEGSYAELRIVPAARLIALPAGIDERTA